MNLGRGAAWVVLVLTFGPVIAVASRAEFWSGVTLSTPDLIALRFTLLQAALSALCSTLLAIPVARALARRRFPGRSLLISLLGAPFLLPVVVAVLGVLAVFGRSGWISDILAVFGLPPLEIYGLGGIVLAHVFLNLPLATRMILQGWARVPAERLRLAASLGAPVWRVVEWPMLRWTLPGVFAVVFVICLGSFAVALILGGGPRSTTVELAIYQALRFDFDLGRAALLASVQAALGLAAAFFLWSVVSVLPGQGSGLDRQVERWDGSRVVDGLWIGLATAFLLAPLSAVVLSGLAGLPDLPNSVWSALGRSLVVALSSCILCLCLALPIAMRPGGTATLASLAPLSASALVVGTGIFILLRGLLPVGALALPVTVLVNGLLALPFAVRVLAPAASEAEAAFGKLSDALGLSGWARIRIVLLPRLRAPLGFAAGLAAALSMGDLGVVTLFAGQGQETLPLAMYRLMGSYRTDAAAAAGLILVVSAFALFWVMDRGGRRGAIS